MLISLNWLKEYVEIAVEVNTLADRLTLAGNEVERILEQEVDVENVVVAEVQGLRPLPGSTKNQLATVTTGRVVTEVVTGAWNLKIGDRVPYALPESRLKDRRIDTKTFLGVQSAGMLCSAIELGLGEDAAGIMIPVPPAPPGGGLPNVDSARALLQPQNQTERPRFLCHPGV